VDQAGERARGATVFVNLEPCAHHGRTPPCADLLIRSGVDRVLAALQDPNPLVNGRGFERLRQAGIAVQVGLLAEEARRLNESFLHWHMQGRPLVTLKAALSLDGLLSAAGGRSRWITGEVARRFAHRLRLRHDAVLVGAETVRRDDPRLTVRLPRVQALRLRAVLSGTVELDPAAKLFQRNAAAEPLTRIYTAQPVGEKRRSLWAGRAELVGVPAARNGLDLGAVLADLGRLGAQSVLVEGGGRTHAAFLEAGLADRAALFQSGALLGARGARPFLDMPAVDEPAQGWRLEPRHHFFLGSDRLMLGRLVRPGG